MGLFEVRRPSHFPSTLLKSVTAVGCHWRVSQGAMELQATMRYKKAKPINPTIFFIYILLWQSNGKVKKFSCALMGLDALRGLAILVSGGSISLRCSTCSAAYGLRSLRDELTGLDARVANDRQTLERKLD